MAEYMKDPIELGETRAEAWAEERISGDMFTCMCGKVIKLVDAQPISPDPWAIPACDECMRKAYG